MLILYSKGCNNMKESIFKAVKKHALVAGLGLILLSSSLVVLANGTWANAQTFRLNNNSGWTGINTAGQRLGNTKQTHNSGWDVHTLAKTMSSSPSARLVNSAGSVRSSSNLTTGAIGRTVSGTQTGEVGFAYFVQVQQAWNQVTNDQTIRVQHRAR